MFAKLKNSLPRSGIWSQLIDSPINFFLLELISFLKKCASSLIKKQISN